jgi:hypothetical protein
MSQAQSREPRRRRGAAGAIARDAVPRGEGLKAARCDKRFNAARNGVFRRRSNHFDALDLAQGRRCRVGLLLLLLALVRHGGTGQQGDPLRSGERAPGSPFRPGARRFQRSRRDFPLEPLAKSSLSRSPQCCARGVPSAAPVGRETTHVAHAPIADRKSRPPSHCLLAQVPAGVRGHVFGSGKKYVSATASGPYC